MQPPRAAGAEQLQKEFPIQLEPPGPGRIFRVESEADLRERIRQESRDRNERAVFPPDIDLVPKGQAFVPRDFPPMLTMYVPDCVCYNPLYFEEKNAERYGWDTGVFQPFLSTAYFYKDVAIFGYNCGVQHKYSCEFNRGYYLPGDAAPYYCYVPPWSAKGAVLVAAGWIGGVAVLP